ncbi:MAG: SDR family oxidoreductase [Proteobacteria bacterium]|nr:SDR family oxidoreductase [Pseudomonadota bacterium]
MNIAILHDRPGDPTIGNPGSLDEALPEFRLPAEHDDFSRKIINISSRGAFRGEPNAPAYGASKAGLNSMSQSLAQALAGSDIMVYAIAPGFVETEMAFALLDGPDGDAIRAQSPLGRAAKPAEIANTIAFLAGPDTDYLTGTIIDINGASYLRN